MEDGDILYEICETEGYSRPRFAKETVFGGRSHFRFLFVGKATFSEHYALQPLGIESDVARFFRDT